jgi:hypothetical protein
MLSRFDMLCTAENQYKSGEGGRAAGVVVTGVHSVIFGAGVGFSAGDAALAAATGVR